jgi:hypothetical protein
MNKEQIIDKLDSYPWDTPTESAMLVGFNETQAIAFHRIKYNGATSGPIITILLPNVEADVTFDYLDKIGINYSNMQFMSHKEFKSMYTDLYDAQSKLKEKKNVQ